MPEHQKIQKIKNMINTRSKTGEIPGGPVVNLRLGAFPAVARVQSLVGGLRSCKPHGVAGKRKKEVKLNIEK